MRRLLILLALPLSAFAQVNCSLTPAPVFEACNVTGSLGTLYYTTGLFSPVSSSNQVPRLPSAIRLTFTWDTSSNLGVYYVVNVYTPQGALTRQYVFSCGQLQGEGNGQNPQIATQVVGGWPPDFRLELVQYVSLLGTTSMTYQLDLLN